MLEEDLLPELVMGEADSGSEPVQTQALSEVPCMSPETYASISSSFSSCSLVAPARRRSISLSRKKLR